MNARKALQAIVSASTSSDVKAWADAMEAARAVLAQPDELDADAVVIGSLRATINALRAERGTVRASSPAEAPRVPRWPTEVMLNAAVSIMKHPPFDSYFPMAHMIWIAMYDAAQPEA